MKRYIPIGILILLSIINFAVAEQASYKEGQLLVRFAQVGGQYPNQTARSSILNAIIPGCCVKTGYNIVPGLNLVNLPSGTTVEEAKTLLEQSSSILYASPNYKRELVRIPNDTRFNELWGLHNTGQTGGKPDADIDAPEAWDIHTGSSNIIVAVTDTGIQYDHPDLAANMWVNTAELNGTPGVDDDDNGYIDDIYGYDFGDSDSNPMDVYGHGTHVAGIVGAVGNNSIGVTGVCWRVRLMAVKIGTDDGDLYITAAIDGIEYAINNGAKVINASWGGYDYSDAERDVIAAAQNAGVIFVAAAGNGYPNNSGIPNNNDGTYSVYPASYDLPNIISVMATDDTDHQSYYSNYGLTSVDIGSPGGAQSFDNDPRGILSTLPNNQYGFYQGTSMASPCVAGGCALILSFDPTLTYLEVKNILLSTVDSTLSGLCVSGGRMNINNALLNAIQAEYHDTTAPVPNPPEWSIEPNATGLHTIVMEAAEADDGSGVEYFFECVGVNPAVPDPNVFNSGWQDETLYIATGLAEGTTYGFRVKARDKSENQNETEWSVTIFTTTASGSDNLPPAPNPSRWEKVPRQLTPSLMGMEAKTSYDEHGPVDYNFVCTSPGYGSLTSGWQPSSTYIKSGLVGVTYTFQVKARDASYPLRNETKLSTEASVTLKAPPKILEVPFPYSTIQSAIDAAANGDTVIVHPGIYVGTGNYNLNFKGKAITVRSDNPEAPDVVAATVIDCYGHDPWDDVNDPNLVGEWRAAWFRQSETRNTVFSGFTIRHGFVKGKNGIDGVIVYDPAFETITITNGTVGGSVAGGAIVCGVDPFNIAAGGSPSNPTISNCVITDCLIMAGNGGNGANGNATVSPDPDVQGLVSNGTHGGSGGQAYGGGIYCDPTSKPAMINCRIDNCIVLAGDGGYGGNADLTSSTALIYGGNGGNGGSALGGGIHCADNPASSAVVDAPFITGCKISNNLIILGLGSGGGMGRPTFLNGSDGFDGVGAGGGLFISKDKSAADSNAITSTEISGNEIDDKGYGHGGGVYFGDNSTIDLVNCRITGNITNYGDGGGVSFGKNCTLLFAGCEISQNVASMGNRAVGGGIYSGNLTMSNSYLTIDNSVIKGNSADYGGGIGILKTNLTINDSEINGNLGSYGGGVYWYDSDVSINCCVITRNLARNMGGGLRCLSGSASINNCTITKNGSGGSGGAVYFIGPGLDPNYTQELNNCLITDNTAVRDGAGISCNDESMVKITNCTIAGNSVSNSTGFGGGLSCYSAFVEVVSSILWGNSAVYGPQIAIGDPLESDNPMATVMPTYSDFQGGEDNVFVGDADDPWLGPWLVPSTTNIDENPLFVTTNISNPNKNYYLSQIAAGQLVDSNCVDAGYGSADALAALVDIDVTTRTDHVADADIVDMGYHYDASDPVTQYQLTIEVVDKGFGTNGKVEPWSVGTDTVNQGRVIELLAIPDPNYKVREWTGTDVVPFVPGDPNRNTVTMISNKVVTVEFETILPSLSTWVIGNGTLSYVNSSGQTVVHPGRTLHKRGEVVQLVAIPNNPTDTVIWTGTDDDYSASKFNTVTIYGNKEVVVEFYTPRILYVPSTDYPSLQRAIDDADDRDMIILAPSNEPYITQLGYRVFGKAITITSANPDDPACVARTVIQQGFDPQEPARRDPLFWFIGVGPDTVLNGLTIRGFRDNGGDGVDGIDPGAPGGDGGWIAGGGILCGEFSYYGKVEAASPTIKNCIITDCIIYGGDGGNGANGGTPPARTTGGEGGWPGVAYGAGLACIDGSSPKVINCTFSNCFASGGNGGDGGDGSDTPNFGFGGAAGGWYWNDTSYLPGWDIELIESHDLYNMYGARGGAVYVDIDSSPQFINCTFTNNRARGGFNGICGIDGAPVDVRHEPATRYRIDNLGGAVYVGRYPNKNYYGPQKPVKFINCVFSDNLGDPNRPMLDPANPDSYNNDDSFVSYGGAVAFDDGAMPIFENCSFNDNFATIGGAIYGIWSDPDIADSSFISNAAYSGGAVHLVGCAADVLRTSFTANDANGAGAQGGALCCLGTDALILDCQITDNSSLGSGGGIYLSSQDNDGGSNIFLKNCLITGNHAARDGGGISANWLSKPAIINCTVANNTVTGDGFETGYGGGVYCSYGNFTNIINSILWGNIAPNGEQLAVATGFEFDPRPSVLDISYSDVQGGESEVYVDHDCTLIWGAGEYGFDPVWSDEFNGTSLNTANWEYMIGDGNDYGLPAGWGNAELQYYRAGNATVSGGNLTITAKEESYGRYNYTSARIRSKNKQDFLYGRMEAKIKVPSGNGMWPAFWMLPTDDVYGGWAASGEIDIMETCNDANYIGGVIHYGGGWPNNVFSSERYEPNGVDFSDDFHIYRVDWEPDVIRWYVDGVLYHIETSATWYSDNAPKNDRAPFDQYFHFLLNVAVGGYYTGCIDPNCVTDDLPQQMVVDYVRVYQKQPSVVHVDNINEEPDFVTGVLGDFYLSQPTSLDPNASTSPAVNTGSDLSWVFGLDTYTTSIEGKFDAGDPNDMNDPDWIVDMGYHYPATGSLDIFDLQVEVIGGNGSFKVNPQGRLNVDGSHSYFEGILVTITAVPDAGWRVRSWDGTDNDSSLKEINTVIMDSNKTVTIEFEQPVTVTVPGEYSTIQQAFDAARDGDIILIGTGLYRTSTGYSVAGKNVTITSENPDDPCVVAATVIELQIGTDGYVNRTGFTFVDVGAETILNGITIRNFTHQAYSGIDGEESGEPGHNGGHAFGGAILCRGASPTIKNCRFVNCQARGGNGGNGDNGADPNLNGGDGGWPGMAYGGAIACLPYFDERGYIEKISAPAIIHCTFENCSVTGGNGGDGGDGAQGTTPGVDAGNGGRGGGWYYGQNIPRWYDVPWPLSSQIYERTGPKRNDYYDYYTKYSGLGGAIYVGRQCAPTITDCTFTGNRCVGGTCGITGLDGWPPVHRLEPSIHWKIDTFGGAVYCDANSEVVFRGCTFNNNVADTSVPVNNDDPFISLGGAVASEDGAEVTFENCTFNGNLATIGGGVYGADSDLEVSDCSLAGNSAYNGGGLYCVGSNVTITGSNITGNSNIDFNDANYTEILGDGGGIYCNLTSARIADSIIIDNSAKKSGGGVYLSGNSDSTIFNCLVTDNVAARDGGGISANWYAGLTISNCTIFDNLVTGNGFETGYGGGIYSSYEGYIDIINSIIWGNRAYTGSQIAVGTGFEYDPRPSTVNVTYSDVQDPDTSILPLDLVLCIDTTGSMYDDIEAVKASTQQILDGIADTFENYRIAIVDYRDFNTPPYGDPDIDYPYNDILGFETNTNVIGDAINSIGLGSGADREESVYSALMHCIDGSSLGDWRSGNAIRVIILMGDAPPHDPEPVTNYTLEDVVAAATSPDSKLIFPVSIGGDSTVASFFGNLAKGTGGIMLQAADANEVVNAIMSAIKLLVPTKEGIYIDPGCTMNWDPVTHTWDANSYNISEDPCFVNGYYLSQIKAGQSVNSLCVDVGSDLVNIIGLEAYTTRTDGVRDIGIVDMGYHYPVSEFCVACDLVKDGIVDFADLASLVSNWLVSGCSAGNNWCDGNDLDFSGTINLEDFSILASCWLFEDTVAPKPDPMTWKVVPVSSANQTWVTMTATTAVDDYFGTIVKYYFECYSGGGHNSNWQTSPVYMDTGLTLGSNCSYRVKARDGRGNETGWSSIKSAIVGRDQTPPVTDPNAANPYKSTWDEVPHALSSTSINMVATTAIDASGVEYYFDCLTIGGHDSSWQDSSEYTDTLLDPNTTYTYRVRARDKWDAIHNNQNVGDWSDEASATTPSGTGPDAVPPTIPSGTSMITAARQRYIYALDGWYDEIVVSVAAVTDNVTTRENLRIQFVCDTWDVYGSDWEYMLGTGAIITGERNGILTYNGDTLTYIVYRGPSQTSTYEWYVCIQDEVPLSSCTDTVWASPIP